MRPHCLRIEREGTKGLAGGDACVRAAAAGTGSRNHDREKRLSGEKRRREHRMGKTGKDTGEDASVAAERWVVFCR